MVNEQRMLVNKQPARANYALVWQNEMSFFKEEIPAFIFC